MHPHLELPAPSWSPWLTGNIEKLEKVQEKAVKMGAGLRAKDYRERCTKPGLETLEERRRNQDLALAHKIMKNKNSILLPIRGDNRVRTRQAAAAHGMAVKYAQTDTRKYSFSLRVVDPWNHLPDTVKTASTLLNWPQITACKATFVLLLVLDLSCLVAGSC